MVTILRFLLIFVVFLSISPSSIGAANLQDVNNLIQGTISYSGSAGNLNINLIQNGVYEIKARQFACSPAENCEPDRYQIDLAKNVANIYGLGMTTSTNQVLIDDFLDTSFGSGHLDSPTDRYEGDVGRMRTPIFVLPSENLIVAYLQPAVKMLRLSRTSNLTSLILKKHNLYTDGSPAPLVVVKGANPSDTYQKYYQYLQRTFSFRKPNSRIFGVGWETFDEFGCTATFPEVTSATNKFIDSGIPLSFAIIGSGYWNNETGEGGCGTPGLPTTDTLVQSEIRYGQYGGLNKLFDNLKAKGIAPAIGMRLNVQLSNVNFIQGKFAASGIVNPFLDGHTYYGNSPSHNARILNAESAPVVDTFINLLQSSYGKFSGIKEDEMFYADQAHIRGLPNLADGFVSKSYPRYYNKLGNEFFIFGRNDWFGVQSDANSGQGWVDVGLSNWNGYRSLKPIIDSAIVQVVSGYPHPMIEPTTYTNSNMHDEAEKNIPSSRNKEYLRITAAQVFMPVSTFSRGFWHVTDSTYRDAAIFFAKLRTRMHSYANDQAQQWFETGVPHLLQPLFIRFNEPAIHSLYSKASSASEVRNEYMFGNALLIRPLFSDSDSVSVYLPSGKWRPFLVAGNLLTGGQYINYQIASPYDFPVFLKEGEIFLLAASDNLGSLQAFVFLDGTNPSAIYTHHKTNGQKVRLQALYVNGQVVIKNLDNGVTVPTQDDDFSKGFRVGNINSLINGPVVGDVTGDGLVTLADLIQVMRNIFGTSTSADLDQNGRVNVIDFAKAFVNLD